VNELYEGDVEAAERLDLDLDPLSLRPSDVQEHGARDHDLAEACPPQLELSPEPALDSWVLPHRLRYRRASLRR
jgi:hypothetical protein